MKVRGEMAGQRIAIALKWMRYFKAFYSYNYRVFGTVITSEFFFIILVWLDKSTIT